MRTDPDAPKHAGITTVVIDMQAEGVEVRPLREATGASMFNEVFFDDVFVPDDDVVGAVDDGWTVAALDPRQRAGEHRRRERRRRWSVDLVDLAAPARAGTTPRLDAVGEHVAEGAAMRALNLRRVERAVAGGEPGPEGNVTKLLSAEHAQRAADLALRLLGPAAALARRPTPGVQATVIFTRR